MSNRGIGLHDFYRRALASELFRGGAKSLLIQVQFVAVQLVTGILLARWLGPSEFGVYSFAMAVVMLILVMPNSGLDNVIIRYSAQYHASQAWAKLKGLWRLGLGVSIGYGVCFGALLAGLSLSGEIPQVAALSPTVLALAGLPVLFVPVLTFLGSAIRGVQGGVLGQLPQFLVRPWIYLVLVLGVYVWRSSLLTVPTVMVLQGTTGFLTVLIGGYWLWRHKPIHRHQAKAEYEHRVWLRSVIPFSLMGGLMLINTQMDILMMGVLTTAHDTGLYRVAAQGANLVALSLTAANLYIGPKISSLYAQGNLHRLQRMLTLSVRSTFGVALGTAAIFWLWGHSLIDLVFGSGYSRAYLPLAILCIGQLINVGAGSVGLILNMTGHERETVKMAGMAAVLNVVLTLVLIPRWGGMGAAIATSITMLIWNGLMLYKVHSKTGLWASIMTL